MFYCCKIIKILIGIFKTYAQYAIKIVEQIPAMKLFGQTQLLGKVEKFRIKFSSIKKKNILARHLVLLPK